MSFNLSCFNRKSPQNAQSWASIVTFLSLIIYVLSILSVIFRFNDSSLFYKIYYPVGVLVSIYGLYATKSASFPRLLPYTVSYFILYAVFIVKAFQTTFLNLPGLKEEMKNDCLDQYQNATEDECMDAAAGQSTSVVLSVSIMLLVMGIFFYLIAAYTFMVKYPVLPEYDQEFGKPEEEYELPAYQGTSPLPPTYQCPPDGAVEGNNAVTSRAEVDPNTLPRLELGSTSLGFDDLNTEAISRPPAAL